MNESSPPEKDVGAGGPLRPSAKSSTCPDAESLAAYADGNLRGAQRQAVERHLAECDNCFETLSGAIGLERARLRRRTLRRRLLVGAGSTAGVAAAVWLAIVLPGRLTSSPTGRPELAALVAAVGTTRVIEPRITGGFAHGLVTAPIRSGESVLDASSPEIRIAVARIEQKAQESRRPEAIAALGVAYLAVANADKAVSALEESTDSPAPDPSGLSDLAAAYLVRGAEYKQFEDVAKALSAAERAVRGNPALAEASFNRALALERLFLTSQAREAWEDYLKVDAGSGWAEEARRHLESLERALQTESGEVDRRLVDQATRGNDRRQLEAVVSQFPQTAREWAENELLIAWPNAYLAGQEAHADSIVARSRRVANILADTLGDRFLKVAVQTIENSNSRVERARLAHAHQLFGEGLVKYEEDALPESMRLFESTAEPLQKAHSPLALWARLQLAIGLYRKAEFKTAVSELTSLGSEADQGGYVRLSGLICRMRGLVHGVQAEFAGQVADYTLALRHFERARDLESVAAIHASLAESWDFQGEPLVGWSQRSQALARLSDVRTFRRLQPILVGSVAACLRQGLPHSALFFQDALLNVSHKWNRAGAVAEGYLKRAEVHQRLGMNELAEQDLAEAEKSLAKISDHSLASRVRAGIHLARAEVQQQSRPDSSVAAVSAALEYFQGARLSWPAARAYLVRGRAHVAGNQLDLAAADFSEGIRVFEEQRAKIRDESLRIAYFEQPWDLFTEMVRLKALRQNQPGVALRVAEQARSRTLLEAVSDSRATIPLDPDNVRVLLPADVALVYFAIVEEGVLTWVLRRDHTAFLQRPIREPELARLVGDSRSSTIAESRRTEALSRLYDELIRPARSSLNGAHSLIVVPDGVLHSLPFAALINRTTGRHLVEDYAVGMTPSITIFLELTRPATEIPPHTALVVGNPRFNETGLKLPPLLGAQDEASDIARIYPKAQLLTGVDATRSRFLELLGQNAVVHFAGHALPNIAFPGLSRLLFAPDRGELSGSLFAHELEDQQMPRVQVVVLAGCRTSTGPIRRGEGVISLARPFLAAGVPVVLATLWDLDDAQGRPLFVGFHQALRRGVAPFEALREAQLAILRNGNATNRAPSTWAGVVAIGGIAGNGPSGPARR